MDLELVASDWDEALEVLADHLKGMGKDEVEVVHCDGRVTLQAVPDGLSVDVTDYVRGTAIGRARRRLVLRPDYI